MSETNNTYLGFSPNNFYYVDAESRGSLYAPDDNCNNISGNLNCEHVSFSENGNICLKQSMCNNKSLAQTLRNEYSKIGNSINYTDNITSYNIYLIKITNLVIGISLIFYFMYNKNKSNSTIQNNIN